LEVTVSHKDPIAVSRGRSGGLKGGYARAVKLSAKKAAKARSEKQEEFTGWSDELSEKEQIEVAKIVGVLVEKSQI
jgi:hypothetical protein